jgi:hypothetical protein
VTHRLSLMVLGWSDGRRVVYRFSGTMTGAGCEQLQASRTDPGTRVFHPPRTRDNGTSGRVAVEGRDGVRTFAYDTLVDGAPAKARFVLSAPSRARGTWRWEVSVADGPWTLIGEGDYRKGQGRGAPNRPERAGTVSPCYAH